MRTEDITKAKIIILHIVADAPGVTYHMLMDKCIESLYMDFFMFSQCIDELISSSMLEKVSETDGTGSNTADSSEDLLYITAGGSAILDDIKPSLDASTRNFLAEAKTSLLSAIHARNSIRVLVEPEQDRFKVILTINSGETAEFKAELYVATREEAASVCAAWKKDPYGARDAFFSVIGAKQA